MSAANVKQAGRLCWEDVDYHVSSRAHVGGIVVAIEATRLDVTVTFSGGAKVAFLPSEYVWVADPGTAPSMTEPEQTGGGVDESSDRSG